VDLVDAELFARRWSRADLARELSVSKSSVSAWLTGGNFTVATMQRILDALRVRVKWSVEDVD
jgi:transcriptional regulator with XRE-family HTH domain